MGQIVWLMFSNDDVNSLNYLWHLLNPLPAADPNMAASVCAAEDLGGILILFASKEILFLPS